MWRLIVSLLLGALMTAVLSAQAADPMNIRHLKPQSEEDIRNSYFISLLGAAMEVTKGEFGPYTLTESQEFVYQSRVFWLLENNRGFDVAWSMTSQEREDKVRPIRIPLMKGLLGVRLFIIREDRRERFSQIHSLEDLKDYTALQGHDWPDTKILSANRLPVRTIPQYSEMFKQISLGKYDYFPRGVLEIYGELETTPYDNLIAEPHLVLTYPAPIYFFVSKQNERLAERLEKGLRMLIANGEFDRLFLEHPVHRKALKEMQLDKRQVLRIRNPDLSEETPLDEPELWWDESLFIL
ncbi:substrate-binding periplasmic protein [Hahella ganghwensis]|uniref:substrate-binding periplasmic protein n=1 Tax=Hahella ganghwensis TaxID=286420 RepID=UPI000370E5F6|nr:transporter substrate-binding domain-containing protein [Hahella ganghwensis]